MDTRFAGSHRLGDRRRRRLAVESEEVADSETPVEELSSPDGARRTVHRRASEPSPDVVALPMTGLVPAQWWKYLLGGLSGLLVGAGILAAGWYESIGAAFAGSGVTRLFALPDGPVAAWYAGLLLNLSAQLAALIWWGRSRSLKDFDGRYRIWTRTAGVWLLFSFCAATGAHHAFSETVLHFAPQNVWGIDVLTWLVPASVLGLTLLVTLNREMSDCRASRVPLFLAAVCYVTSGGLRLPFEIPLDGRLREMALVGSSLLGHLCLFLSMWLHARHVLHHTPDPSRTPRRRLRIPRPHFRLPGIKFGWRQSNAPSAEVSDSTAPEPRERKRRPRKSGSTAKAKIEPVEPIELESTDESPAAAIEQEPIDEHEPLTLPTRREAQRPPVVPEPQHVPAPVQNDRDDESSADEADEAWTESFPKPDMRGMSKKQRRKLMQELREKERSTRRR